ncbi:45 kDa calcium-binding protein isoform X2 [Drosophila navojoa]|uniref:45 kDa calcium-binding protein isoform X2 n=1 Tax=Drosophila navojoa TaxID=7232 RepID=UPI0011BEBE9E|nr:45 kDa calcium-binding protein isoform X2 [Drosophila navojoa]
MTFLNKLSKSFRWLRCSTLCAILFYMFFIGLILHSTSHKLQQQHQQQQQQQQQQSLAEAKSMLNERPNSREQQQQQQQLQEQQQPLQHQQQQQQQEEENQKLKSQSQLATSNLVLGNGQTKEQQRRKLQPIAANRAGDAKGREDAGTASSKTSQPQPETVILTASNVNEKQILAKAFKRADRNHDGRLSIQELGQYINKRIVEHIDIAIMNNAREFRRVDIAPADGLITWEEYHRFFLREHGMTEADINEHDEIRHTTLNRKAREDMMRDKARWSEAARTDLFTLTIDEYLSFRHPESSVSNLLELVDDLLRQFDQDGDDQLTLEEFSDLNVDDDEDLLRKSLISKTLVERREEFKRIIDRNHDGKADRGELLNYVNPKTPRYALQEAATLFSLCDENKDELLTLKEMTDNAEIFLQSKMIDTANSFHTEF